MSLEKICKTKKQKKNVEDLLSQMKAFSSLATVISLKD